MNPVASIRPRELDARCDGALFAAADEGWDAARQAWNLAVDQRPAAVACPLHADDVAAIVGYARESGLRVAPQCTGHNARPLGSLEDTILVRMSALRGIEIDLDRRIARVCAGDLWEDVLGPAAAHVLPVWPDRRPTSTSSATRSAAASAGSRASTACRPTASPRSSSSPPTDRSCAPTASTSPICSGRCAVAAGTSASSPRSSSRCTP